VHDAVNAHPDMIGREIVVDLSGDALRFTSQSYGINSSLNVDGGTALAVLGLTGSEADVGVDVAGEFIVDGLPEAATGKGRLLVGNTDNKFTADLQLQINLVASQLGVGNESELTVSKGVGSKLDAVLNQMLSADTGRFASINDRYNQEIEALNENIDRQNALFESQQARLVSQFVALEAALAELQSTSSLLGTQLASLATLNSPR
jgi:flagellar hook-associated protein 2